MTQSSDSSVASPADEAPETDIIACERRLYAAQLASDTDALDALLADELLFVGPNGEIVSKQMDLELHRSASIRIEALMPGEQMIRCFGDSALAVTRIAMRGSMLGQRFDGELRYLRVWRHGLHGWQVIGGSVSPCPESAAK